MCYIYYYLETIGIRDAWTVKDLFVIAAGDDVSVFTPKKLTQKVYDAIMNNTARAKNQKEPVGLGQCVT